MRRDWMPFNTPQVQKAKAKHPDTHTTAELANLIGRTEYTVRKWRKEGTLKPKYRVKTGGSTVCLYDNANLEQAKLLTKTLKPGRVPAANTHTRKAVKL